MTFVLPPAEAIGVSISLCSPMVANQFAASFRRQHRIEPSTGWDLLAEVFNFQFSPSKADRPFGPMMISEGRRSMIPDDVTDEQLDALWMTFEKVDDPEYRARVGDVIWLRRRDATAARAAVNAYLEAGLRVEDIKRWPPAMERYQRAIRLAHQIDPKGALPRDALKFLENRVRHYDGHDPLYFTLKGLELLVEFRFGDFDALADIARRVSDNAKQNDDFRRTRSYLDVQAKLLKLAKNPSAAEGALVASAECFVAEAEAQEKAGSFLAAHSFWEDAIRAFRQRPSLRSRVGELHKRLAVAGKKSLAEMEHYSHEVDIKEVVEWSENLFRGLSFDDALLRLATIFPLIDPAKLREESLETIGKHPLQASISTTIVDEAGRKIGTRPAVLGADEGTQSVAIEGFMDEHARLHRSFHVSAYLAPAMRTLLAEHDVTDEEIERLIGDSTLIPEDRLPLFIKAIGEGFKWDFSTSLHIFVPQIENALRYLLEKQGVVPRTIDQDGIEEVWSLERILSNPKTRSILDEKFVYELQSLLAGRLGPNLRNALAHGLLSPASLNGDTAFYLWWVLYRLSITPTSAMRALAERNRDDTEQKEDAPLSRAQPMPADRR